MTETANLIKEVQQCFSKLHKEVNGAVTALGINSGDIIISQDVDSSDFLIEINGSIIIDPKTAVSDKTVYECVAFTKSTLVEYFYNAFNIKITSFRIDENASTIQIHLYGIMKPPKAETTTDEE